MAIPIRGVLPSHDSIPGAKAGENRITDKHENYAPTKDDYLVDEVYGSTRDECESGNEDGEVEIEDLEEENYEEEDDEDIIWIIKPGDRPTPNDGGYTSDVEMVDAE